MRQRSDKETETVNVVADAKYFIYEDKRINILIDISVTHLLLQRSLEKPLQVGPFIWLHAWRTAERFTHQNLIYTLSKGGKFPSYANFAMKTMKAHPNNIKNNLTNTFGLEVGFPSSLGKISIKEMYKKEPAAKETRIPDTTLVAPSSAR